MSIKTVEGNLNDSKARFGILAARFNDYIVDSLIKGAFDALERHGVKDSQITLIRVPGAFEMPLVAQRMAESKQYDAIIALGAVIRGATPHFEYVAGECIKGLAQVSLQYTIPVAHGVLTVDNIEQAIERAGTKAGNKGADAAMTAIEMVDVLRQLS